MTLLELGDLITNHHLGRLRMYGVKIPGAVVRGIVARY